MRHRIYLIHNSDNQLELREIPAIYPPDVVLDPSKIEKIEEELRIAQSSHLPDEAEQDDDI